MQDLLALVNEPHFDGNRAIEMLQQRYTINYGSRNAGSRPAHAGDEYHPAFFLDMIIIVGRPLRPITQRHDRFFDNITITFKNWRSSYSCKHIHGFSFNLQHRTFRLATAATRESWFIVMHPVGAAGTEFGSSRRERQQQLKESSQSSALQTPHAQFLATYIKQVFLADELLGEGVEDSWRLDGPQARNLTANKWTTFQHQFVEHWNSYIAAHTTDPFWRDHQPAFHAYDYGANIDIKVDEQLQSLDKETSLRPPVDHSESEVESENDLDGLTPTSGSPLPSLGSGLDADSYGLPSQRPHRVNLSNNRPTPNRPSSVSSDQQGSDEDNQPALVFLPTGLAELRTDLERKYVLDHVESISFALAIDINCADARLETGTGQAAARCLLADRNHVAQEFRGARDFTFYPLGFHPAYGNFSSPRPPAFLADRVLTVMKDNMSYRNAGADPLSFGYFQAYSNIKRGIRYGPDDLLATKGIATAALTLPASEAESSARLQAKRSRLREQLLGRQTPDDPDASRPFARERRRIDAAVEGEEFAFRMEQVLNVQVSRLLPAQRQFSTVLQPILQIIRFYLHEPEHYTYLLRSFPPAVFPGILAAYARIFDVCLTELRQRVEAGAATVAEYEGVALLDRAGSFCFTGFPRSLMGSVLRPLGTIQSLEQAAWPYISPRLLDLREHPAHLNISKWPRDNKGRPILMHVAALSYHYGPAVGISRHTHVWFQELGGRSMTGPSGISKLLEDLFQELWVPQMVAFVRYQVERAIRRVGPEARVDGDGSPATSSVALLDLALDRWSSSQQPFSRDQYEAMISQAVLATSGLGPSISSQARQDFSRELYSHCVSSSSSGAKGLRSANATWLSILQKLVQATSREGVSAGHWVAAISGAMLSSGIDCVPGRHQSRLSHRRIVRLVGHERSLAVLSAPAGTLKRAALEAEQRTKRVRRQPRVRFGSGIPFEKVPELVRTAFESQQQVYASGDQQVLEHYQVAYNCLQSCLGDPVCDLLLMLVLTLGSCSVTPTVAVRAREFSVGARKDAGAFTATLVTRMLWFFRPQDFPWKGGHPVILPVGEMTKKIEHKGVSNRLLVQLGWVRVLQGNRDTPRNSELGLQDREKLHSYRKELLGLRRDGAGFIRRVFGSDEEVWVDRCTAILGGSS